MVLSFEGRALGGGVISTCPIRRTGVEHAKRPRCSVLFELLKTPMFRLLQKGCSTLIPDVLLLESKLSKPIFGGASVVR